MYIILSGSVEIQCSPKYQTSLSEYIIAKTLKKGETVGDLDLFLKTARTGSAMSLSSSTTCVLISKQSFESFLTVEYTLMFADTMNAVSKLHVFAYLPNNFAFVKTFFDIYTEKVHTCYRQVIFT